MQQYILKESRSEIVETLSISDFEAGYGHCSNLFAHPSHPASCKASGAAKISLSHKA